MALLLLRHTLTITNSDDEDDASAIFSVSDKYAVLSPMDFFLLTDSVDL
jgi:hypothetical protein